MSQILSLYVHLSVVNPVPPRLMIEIQSCFLIMSPFSPRMFLRSNISTRRKEVSKISYFNESFNSSSFYAIECHLFDVLSEVLR